MFLRRFLLTILIVAMLGPVGVQAQDEPVEIAQFTGTEAVWSPDGSLLAIDSGLVIRVVDPLTGDEVSTLRGFQDRVLTYEWSPDGRRVLAGSSDGTARIWDALSGAEVASLTGHEGRAFRVAWSPDGARVVTSDDERHVFVWDVASGLRQATLTNEQFVGEIAWSPDGTRLLCVLSFVPAIQVWDMQTFQTARVFKDDSPAMATWSPDGAAIISKGNGKLLAWDAATGAHLMEAESDSIVGDMIWSPDHTHLLLADAGGRARIWSWPDVTLLTAFDEHTDRITSAAWSPDGTRVATGARNGEIFVWDAATGEVLWEVTGYTGWVYSTAWSPDGSLFVTAAGGGNVRVWRVGEAPVVPAETTPVWIVYSGSSADLYLLNPDTGEQVQLTEGMPFDTAPEWSPDGTQIAFERLGGRSVIYLIGRDGTNLRPLLDGGGEYASPTWSPDGTQIAYAASFGGESQLYISSADGTSVEMTGVAGEGPAWSPDGYSIAFTRLNEGILLLDVASGSVRSLLEEDEVELVYSLDWSPDGRRIAFHALDAAGSGRHVYAVDLAGNIEQLTTGSEDDCPAWTPDGRSIIYASVPSGDTSIYLYRLDLQTGAVTQLTTDYGHHPDVWIP